MFFFAKLIVFCETSDTQFCQPKNRTPSFVNPTDEISSYRLAIKLQCLEKKIRAGRIASIFFALVPKSHDNAAMTEKKH